jgi:predicted PolB exonuclease-like 3'-5' exonuclease
MEQLKNFKCQQGSHFMQHFLHRLITKTISVQFYIIHDEFSAIYNVLDEFEYSLGLCPEIGGALFENLI